MFLLFPSENGRIFDVLHKGGNENHLSFPEGMDGDSNAPLKGMTEDEVT